MTTLTLKATNRTKRLDHVKVGDTCYYEGKFWVRSGIYISHQLGGDAIWCIGVTGGSTIVREVEVK